MDSRSLPCGPESRVNATACPAKPRHLLQTKPCGRIEEASHPKICGWEGTTSRYYYDCGQYCCFWT